MKKEEIIRYSVLSFFLILFTVFSLRHFILGGGVSASVDALCPFGGFETLFTFIATGGFVPRILISSLILGLGVLLTVLVFRRGFCGYVCPFGFVQELMGKIRKKKVKVPEEVDKYGRFLKYLILLAILIGTTLTGVLVFRSFDPFMSFFHFGKGILWDYDATEFIGHLIPFIIMAVVLVGSIFIERFWCKYFCPLGAVMGIFNKLGLTKLKRNKKTCIDCKLCDKKCPVGLKISKINSMKSSECLNCNQCVNVCPKNSLSQNIGKKKIPVIYYIMGLIALFFLVIGISKVAGIWQSVPGSNLENIGGKLNADNIKGWMTLNIISKETGISLNEFIISLGLPTNIDGDLPLKEIKDFYDIEFETSELREFVTNSQQNSEKETDCLWGLVDDPYPGRCGLYTDSNQNSICDYSE